MRKLAASIAVIGSYLDSALMPNRTRRAKSEPPSIQQLLVPEPVGWERRKPHPRGGEHKPGTCPQCGLNSYRHMSDKEQRAHRRKHELKKGCRKTRR